VKILEGSKPICPLFSTAQIVPFGAMIKGGLQTKPAQSIDLTSVRTGGAARGPVGYNGGFEAQIFPAFKTMAKEEGDDGDAPNALPDPIPNPISVRFIGEECAAFEDGECNAFGNKKLVSLLEAFLERVKA